MKYVVKKDAFGSRPGEEFVEFYDDQGRKLGAIWAGDDGRSLEVVSRFHAGHVDGSNAKKLVPLDLSSSSARMILAEIDELGG